MITCFIPSWVEKDGQWSCGISTYFYIEWIITQVNRLPRKNSQTNTSKKVSHHWKKLSLVFHWFLYRLSLSKCKSSHEGKYPHHCKYKKGCSVTSLWFTGVITLKLKVVVLSKTVFESIPKLEKRRKWQLLRASERELWRLKGGPLWQASLMD